MRLFAFKLDADLIDQLCRHSICQINVELALHQHAAFVVDLNDGTKLGRFDLIGISIVDQEFNQRSDVFGAKRLKQSERAEPIKSHAFKFFLRRTFQHLCDQGLADSSVRSSDPAKCNLGRVKCCSRIREFSVAFVGLRAFVAVVTGSAPSSIRIAEVFKDLKLPTATCRGQSYHGLKFFEFRFLTTIEFRKINV